jgi:hypothetical protein
MPKPEDVTLDLSAPFNMGTNSLLLAAGMFQSLDKPSSNPSSFFNGRLNSPCFKSLASKPQTFAQFDFSKEIGSDTIVDVSRNARHGVLFNAPTREVRGYDWDGSEPDFTKAKFATAPYTFTKMT